MVDTNVIIAAIQPRHDDHAASIALFERARDGTFAVSPHVISEAYNQLTRPGGLYKMSPDAALQALRAYLKITLTISLTADQTMAEIGAYAEGGGVGARLYDHLIGATATANGVSTIVTWNINHMRSLFPACLILTPSEWKPGQP